jgi:hypothetical protein
MTRALSNRHFIISNLDDENDTYIMTLDDLNKKQSLMGRIKIHHDKTPVIIYDSDDRTQNGRASIRAVNNDEVDNFLQTNPNSAVFSGQAYHRGDEQPTRQERRRQSEYERERDNWLANNQGRTVSDFIRHKDAVDEYRSNELGKYEQKGRDSAHKAGSVGRQLGGLLTGGGSLLSGICGLFEMSNKDSEQVTHSERINAILSGYRGVTRELDGVFGSLMLGAVENAPLLMTTTGVNMGISAATNALRVGKVAKATKSVAGITNVSRNASGMGRYLTDLAGTTATYGASQAGNTYSMNRGREDITHAQKVQHALAIGIVESILENTWGAVGGTRRWVNSMGKKHVSEIMARSMLKSKNPAVHWLASSLGEGVTEIFCGIGRYALDKYMLGDYKDMDTFHQELLEGFAGGALGALLISPVMSGVMSGQMPFRNQIPKGYTQATHNGQKVDIYFPSNIDSKTREATVQAIIRGENIALTPQVKEALNKAILGEGALELHQRSELGLARNSEAFINMVDLVARQREAGMFSAEPHVARQVLTNLLNQTQGLINNDAVSYVNNMIADMRIADRQSRGNGVLNASRLLSNQVTAHLNSIVPLLSDLTGLSHQELITSDINTILSKITPEVVYNMNLDNYAQMVKEHRQLFEDIQMYKETIPSELQSYQANMDLAKLSVAVEHIQAMKNDVETQENIKLQQINEAQLKNERTRKAMEINEQIKNLQSLLENYERKATELEKSNSEYANQDHVAELDAKYQKRISELKENIAVLKKELDIILPNNKVAQVENTADNTAVVNTNINDGGQDGTQQDTDTGGTGDGKRGDTIDSISVVSNNREGDISRGDDTGNTGLRSVDSEGSGDGSGSGIHGETRLGWLQAFPTLQRLYSESTLTDTINKLPVFSSQKYQKEINELKTKYTTIVKNKSVFNQSEINKLTDELLKRISESKNPLETIQNLTDTERATIYLSTGKAEKSTQHYTASGIYGAMHKLLDVLGVTITNDTKILEPAVGGGAMLDGITHAQITAGDIDIKNVYKVLSLYPQTAVFEKNFAAKDYVVKPEFDIVIGNPPFQYLPSWNTKHFNGKASNADGFTLKSLDALKEGGHLIFVNSHAMADKLDTTFREAMIKSADVVGMVTMPSGMFPGADVSTDIYILRKRKQGDDVNTYKEINDLFISSMTLEQACNTSDTINAIVKSPGKWFKVAGISGLKVAFPSMMGNSEITTGNTFLDNPVMDSITFDKTSKSITRGTEVFVKDGISNDFNNYPVIIKDNKPYNALTDTPITDKDALKLLNNKGKKDGKWLVDSNGFLYANKGTDKSFILNIDGSDISLYSKKSGQIVLNDAGKINDVVLAGDSTPLLNSTILFRKDKNGKVQAVDINGKPVETKVDKPAETTADTSKKSIIDYDKTQSMIDALRKKNKYFDEFMSKVDGITSLNGLQTKINKLISEIFPRGRHDQNERAKSLKELKYFMGHFVRYHTEKRLLPNDVKQMIAENNANGETGINIMRAIFESKDMAEIDKLVLSAVHGESISPVAGRTIIGMAWEHQSRVTNPEAFRKQKEKFGDSYTIEGELKLLQEYIDGKEGNIQIDSMSAVDKMSAILDGIEVEKQVRIEQGDSNVIIKDTDRTNLNETDLELLSYTSEQMRRIHAEMRSELVVDNMNNDVHMDAQTELDAKYADLFARYSIANDITDTQSESRPWLNTDNHIAKDDKRYKNKDVKRAVDVFKNVFGTEIVLCENMGKYGGVYIGADGKVYVSPEHINNVYKHEFIHDLRYNNTESYNQIVKLLEGSDIYQQWETANKDKMAEKYKDEKLSEVELKEEMVAQFLQENMTNKHYWEMLASKDKNVFTKAWAHMKYFFDRIYNYLSDKYGDGYKTGETYKLMKDIEREITIAARRSADVRGVLKDGQLAIERYTLESVNETFNKSLQDQIDGKLNDQHVYQMGMPSGILQSAGIPNLPIEMSARRLLHKSQQSNHPFDLSDVKNLPNAIDDPIAVFDSTRGSDSKVILTELQHSTGNFLVVLDVGDANRNKTISVEVKSVYPKDHIQGVIDWINSSDSLLKYVDKQKALAYIQAQRALLTDGENVTNAINIINNFVNPPVSQVKKSGNSVKENLSDSKNKPKYSINDSPADQFTQLDSEIRSKYPAEAVAKYERQLKMIDNVSEYTADDKAKMKQMWAESFDEFVKANTMFGDDLTIQKIAEVRSLLNDTDIYKNNKKLINGLTDGWTLSTLTMGLQQSAERNFRLSEQYQYELDNNKGLSKTEIDSLTEKRDKSYQLARSEYLQYQQIVSGSARILRYHQEHFVSNPIKKKVESIIAKKQAEILKQAEKDLLEGKDTKADGKPKDPLKKEMSRKEKQVDEAPLPKPNVYDHIHTALYNSMLNWIVTPIKSAVFTGWTGADLLLHHGLFNYKNLKNVNVDKGKWLKKSTIETWSMIKDAFNQARGIDTETNMRNDEFGNSLKYALSQGRFDLSEASKFTKAFFWYSDNVVSKPLQASDVATKIFASNYFMESIPALLAQKTDFVKEYYGEGVTTEQAILKMQTELAEAFRTGEKSPLKDLVMKWSEYAAMTNKPEGHLGTFAEWYKGIQDKLYKDARNNNDFGNYCLHFAMAKINPFLRITANLVNSQLGMAPGLGIWKWIQEKSQGKKAKEKATLNKEQMQEAYKKYIDELNDVMAGLDKLTKEERMVTEKAILEKMQLAKAILTGAVMQEATAHLNVDMRVHNAMVRQVTGVLITACAVVLAMLGKVSGSGSSYSQEERERLEATGWRSNAVKVGDTWVQYTALPYVMLPIAMGGEVIERFKNHKVRNDESELFSYFMETVGAMTGSIANLDIIGGNVNFVDMVVNQKASAVYRFIAQSTNISPTQWAATRNVTDMIVPQQNRPRTILEHIKHENRALTYLLGGAESIPSRYNMFGDKLENRTFHHARGKSGVLATIGHFAGVGIGYESIKNPTLLSMSNSIIGVGERVPASNGRVEIKVGKESRPVTQREREAFFRYRGEEYSRLFLRRQNYINKLVRDIQSGKESSRELLQKELQSLHRKANDFGKQRVERMVAG